MNKKKKFNLNVDFSISDRDKKLLILLVAVLILAGAYWFGYRNLMGMTEKYQQEATILKVKKKDLTEKNNKKDQYIADTMTYKNTYSSVFSCYSNGTSQDATLQFLSQIETITGSWIKSTNFTQEAVIYPFGKISSSNPQLSGGSVYTTDMKGVKSTVTLGYEATYAQWKTLITYINTYYNKNTIDSISMTYNNATGVVSGTMALSIYAITGSQRAFTHPAITVSTGTDNIFASDTFAASSSKKDADYGAYIYGDYDYYMMLNAATSDLDACIIGNRNDTTKGSVLSSNSATKENVTIKFTGSSGNYKVQYMIGKTTYPATNYDAGTAFEPGSTLDFLIMSSARVSSTDTSGVDMTIVNESDKTLNIKVSNDDTTNPRLNVVTKTGDITIYQ